MRKQDVHTRRDKLTERWGSHMRYNDNNRGEIFNQKNFHQRVLFGGMKFGKCMPTDIDAALEFGGKTLVLYELKYGDAPVPHGQLLLLQRIVDAWATDGKQAVLFICRHTTKSDRDVMLTDAIVSDVYYQGKMKKPKGKKTAKQATDDFLRFADVIA